MRKNFASKALLYLIGNLSTKLLSAILIPIYAFYVSTEDLGAFDYMQTLMLIATPIIFLAIWEAILKFGLERNSDDYKKIITSSLVFTIAAAGLILLGAIVISFYDIQLYNVGYLSAMFLVYGCVQVWQSACRVKGDNAAFAVSGIISTIVNFAGILVMIGYLQVDSASLALFYIIGQLSAIVWIEIKIHLIQSTQWKYFDIFTLKEMLKFSSPLVLNIISAWLINGLCRVVVNQNFGSEANGLFAFANKFSMLISMLGSVITMALIEELYIKKANGNANDYLKLAFNKIAKLLFSIISVMVPFLVGFYIFFKSTNYSESLQFAPILILYAVFAVLSTCVGGGFQITDNTHFIFITTLIGGALTAVCLYIIVVTKSDIIWVAFAQLVGAFVMFIARCIFARNYSRIMFDVRNIFVYVLYYILISIISIKNYGNAPILISIAVLNAVFLTWYNREMILRVASFVQKKGESDGNFH